MLAIQTPSIKRCNEVARIAKRVFADANCKASERKSQCFALESPPPRGIEMRAYNHAAKIWQLLAIMSATMGSLPEIPVPMPAPIAPAITLRIRLVESAATNSCLRTSCASDEARAVYKIRVSAMSSPKTMKPIHRALAVVAITPHSVITPRNAFPRQSSSLRGNRSAK